MSKDYSDMLNLPHHESKTHPHMPLLDRAAQFSPFAALTGYEDVIKETSRLTDDKKGVASDKAEEISRKLQLIEMSILLHPVIRVRYFLKDGRKKGGSYLEYEGEVRRIDEFEKKLVFVSGVAIPIADIHEIEGNILMESFD